MNKTILELKNISKSFDNKKTYILKDVNFSLHKWENLSIIWLNWAWKTSLLKIISWIIKPSSWEIIKNYKTLSYVPQKIDIDKTFPIKVGEFIEIYNKKVDFGEVKIIFKKFDFEKLLNRQIWTLSGWELQKVLIVSALISKPEIILLDEPTAWIDLVWEEIFYEIITQVKEIFPEIAIVLVSHNLNLVYKNSDYIICLHKDNFCCHWTPKEEKFNKKLKEIYWDYLVSYEHNPHDRKTHKN